MSKDSAYREHIHKVFLNFVYYVGVSKLMAKLECSKSAAILYALNEGLFREDAISKEDHDLFAKRYGRPLKEVIAEAKERREPSHVSVLTIEQRKEKRILESKDRQFMGMIDQWNDHKDLTYRVKAVADAEKYKGKLQSARDLLDLAEKEESAN